MNKSLDFFSPDTFDYIIVDECHHATAETYKRIIEYFDPEFLLGLTATPERLDKNDVFGIFNRNVPYELRLRDAIVNEIVVPFRYFGIRDTLINYGLSYKEERRLIAELASEQHAEFISSQIEKRKPPGKLKALAFCRNITHARMMSEVMGEKYKTIHLTGANSIGERIRAYNDLQNDSNELEILFTVDILNEGVDIPGVNMVLFLRPTESSTVFIQQLGRGLRKFENKSYVTVLDFIGNSYKRSTQIALALGSLSENFILEKKLLQSLVKDSFLPLGLAKYGVEISFDDLSKEEIISSIESENFNSLTYVKQDYQNFKRYINSESFPSHIDFLNNDCAPELLRFMAIKINWKKNFSYYNFLRGIEEENLPTFSENQVSFINYLSEMLPLVRKHEFLILDCLLQGITKIDEIKVKLQNNITGFSELEFEHALKFMEGSKFFQRIDGVFIFNFIMESELNDYIKDLIGYGLKRFLVEFGESTDFKLWQSYRMDQVQLKFLKNPKHNQVGTYYYGDSVVIFASLKKDASTIERLNYKDKFLESRLFQWESMVNISKDDLKKLNASKEVYLFIRKVSEENGITLPFTFVGKGIATNPRKIVKFDQTKQKEVFSYLFDIPMENELPDYLKYDFGVEN